jgi:hypothetical protein
MDSSSAVHYKDRRWLAVLPGRMKRIGRGFPSLAPLLLLLLLLLWAAWAVLLTQVSCCPIRRTARQ